MEANRESAQELMRRGRVAKDAGDLHRAVQLMQRACAMYSDRAQERELSEVRMLYARQRDERNNAQEAAARHAAAEARIPIPQSMRRVLARYVGAARVDAVVGMFGIVIFLGVLRKLVVGRALWTALGKLPGDLNMSSGNMSLHLPVVSSMLISVLLSWLLRTFFVQRQVPPQPSHTSSSSRASSARHEQGPPPFFPGYGSFVNPLNPFQWLPGVQANANFQRGNVQMHGGVYFCAIQ